MIQDLGLAVALQDGEGLFVMTLVLLEPMVQIVQAHACVRIRAELQRRSSKVLEKRSFKRLLYVGNLYQPLTTLGLQPVSILHYTKPVSSGPPQTN